MDSKNAENTTVIKNRSMNQLKEGETVAGQSAVRFFKGMGVGFCAAAILQPLQVIKTSMQITPLDDKKLYRNKQAPEMTKASIDPAVAMKKKKIKLRNQFSFREAALKIYANEGPKGFTRGLVPSVIKNSFLTGQFFSVLFYAEQLLGRFNFFTDSQKHSMAGAFARTVSTIMGNPITIIKTRFEVVGFNQYSGVLDATSKIYKQEGIPGFFQGLKISLIRDVPFSGIFYPIYNGFRSHLMSYYEQDQAESQSTGQRVKVIAIIASASSFMANCVSCTITHPLDLIRTRAYFKFHNKDKIQQYDGILNGAMKIYQTEGVLGFYRGLMPRIFRKGLGSIIVWTMFEFLIDKNDMIMKVE